MSGDRIQSFALFQNSAAASRSVAVERRRWNCIFIIQWFAKNKPA
jgi:hypothetical protein